MVKKNNNNNRSREIHGKLASYLFQRIAVTTQRFNSVLFRDFFVAHESQDDSDA